MTKKLTFGAFILSLALTGSFFGLASAQEGPEAPATVLLTDDFAYPDGSLLTANGWTAHSAGGTNALAATPPNLTYTGYPNTGNSVAMATSGEDVHRVFAAQTSGTVYAAFLVNLSEASLDPAGGYFFHLGTDPIGSTFRGRVFAKKDANNNVAFGISKASTTAANIGFTPFAYSLNTTYLLVVKYTIVSGDSNDTASLIVNPTVPGAEPAVTVSALDNVDFSDVSIASAAIRQGSTATSPTLRFDGLRIATTWDEAVGAAGAKDAPSDFNGDGKTDFSVLRAGAGGAGGQFTWWTRINGTNAVSITPFGLNSDFHVPADYDGDKRDDIAVWRPAGNKGSGFWILFSDDSTAVFVQFGEPGDDPWVVDDYTGDGVDDIAIYRPGASDNEQSFFWYLASSGPFANQHVATAWGLGSDFAVPGDYNGDGRADFTVVRTENNRSVVYTHTNNSGQLGVTTITQFGLPTDFYVPGDYDGDGATDLAISRAQGSNILWIYRPSGGGADVWQQWGRSATDFEAPGDYDGDGKTDLAVWRDANPRQYIIRPSGGGAAMFETWGASGDIISIWAVK